MQLYLAKSEYNEITFQLYETTNIYVSRIFLEETYTYKTKIKGENLENFFIKTKDKLLILTYEDRK